MMWSGQSTIFSTGVLYLQPPPSPDLLPVAFPPPVFEVSGEKGWVTRGQEGTSGEEEKRARLWR